MSGERHVVSVSSGAASAYLWALVRLAHPDAIGVFADVNGEDDEGRPLFHSGAQS